MSGIFNATTHNEAVFNTGIFGFGGGAGGRATSIGQSLNKRKTEPIAQFRLTADLFADFKTGFELLGRTKQGTYTQEVKTDNPQWYNAEQALKGHRSKYLKVELNTKGTLISSIQSDTKLEAILDFTGIIKKLEHLAKNERFFEFDEEVTDEKLRAFTHSSSFVGNVRYNSEDSSMRIILNGKNYDFCSVPERIFDSFEGADSKGAFFNRNIKEQFSC